MSNLNLAPQFEAEENENANENLWKGKKKVFIQINLNYFK